MLLKKLFIERKTMKYVAEQDREFTDMDGVKIYRSICPPANYPVETIWGPIIRFDNKVLLPGRQDVEHFTDIPIQVIRIAINGITHYYDSWGYKTALGEQDILEVNSGKDTMSATLQNMDDQTETELLEIWLSSNNNERSCQFHSLPINRENGRFYNMISTNAENGEPQQKKWLHMGFFVKGTSHTLNKITQGNLIILFVFNGSLTANNQQLLYRDTAIFSHDASIQLHFKKDTNLLMMEIELKEAGL
jgi:redox-sensitive bicupin YhaK (pirin superfamily)